MSTVSVSSSVSSSLLPPFKGDDYSSWSKTMMAFLEYEELWEVVVVPVSMPGTGIAKSIIDIEEQEQTKQAEGEAGGVFLVRVVAVRWLIVVDDDGNRGEDGGGRGRRRRRKLRRPPRR